jgi:PAS domain S-box-containing protein
MPNAGAIKTGVKDAGLERVDVILRALAEASGVALTMVDRSRRIRYANDLAAKQAQRPCAEQLGLRYDELLPVVGPEVDALIAKVIETGVPSRRNGFRADWGRVDFDVLPVPGPSGVDGALVVTTAPDPSAPEQPGLFLRDRKIIVDMTSRLLRMTPETADELLTGALGDIAREYRIDRAYVRILSESGDRYEITHQYEAPGMRPLRAEDDKRDLRLEGALLDTFRRGEPRFVESIDRLAPDDQLREVLERAGCRAGCGVSIGDGADWLGRLVFFSVEERKWPEVAVSRFRVFGELFGIAIRRVRAESALHDRLRFEESLATVFARLADARPADLDAELSTALHDIAKALRMERTVISLLDEARERFVVTHEWSATPLPSLRLLATGLPSAEFGWPHEHILRGETVNVTREEVPESAHHAKAFLDRAGIRSMAVIPLSMHGEVIGHCLFQCTRRTARIPQDVIARLHVVAGVFASTIARCRAEESLRESESRFTQIIETALDGVVVLDETGVVVEWTSQAERLFGRERHEVVGRRFADFALDPNDKDRIQSRDGMTLAPGRIELLGVHRNKHTFPLELSVTRMKRGMRTIIALFVRDITDRKRVEQERQRAFDEVARQKATAERERDYLREEVANEAAQMTIVGESAAIRRALESAEAVATTGAAVLIHGESGVGKELFARTIHAHSKRAGAALVKVNCASIPESLFESEFFGHVRGSFTGAHKDRVGRFELADGGTLFLDEVGEIPLDMQAKLLRVLQEGEFERVGDDRTRKVDVRIVAATNRDLAEEVRDGRFRRDLYYRLSVFPIEVPPLRDRREDIIPLAQAFLRSSARSGARPGFDLTAADKALLLDYDWPGNIRELLHVIERAMILSPTPPLRLERALAPSRAMSRQSSPRERVSEAAVLTHDELRKLERSNLVAALERSNGRVSGEGGAAELLGINPSTLRDRMKALGIARR